MPQISPLTLIAAIFVLRLNFAVWGLIGACRVVDEKLLHRGVRPTSQDTPGVPEVVDVAAILPAHNEALVIERTLETLARILPVENIHVVSDGSNDDTQALAQSFGVRVLGLMPGRGKASALAEGISYFDLLARFRVILIVDADSRLDKEYLHRGLQCFADPRIAAVAGFVTTDWPTGKTSWWSRCLIAYRERVYVLTQYLQKYGQTWGRTNVTYIVPGFASMYRSDALAQIDIDAPGLIIEDFNMTFDLHHKHLGQVAFYPDIIAHTQDPHRLSDYVRQVKRWQLGFWQTIRRHGLWVSGFTASLTFMIVELVAASVILVALPFALGLIALRDAGVHLPLILSDAAGWSSGFYNPWLVLLFVFLADYVLSCVVAAVQRRPSYLVLGLAFLPIRVIDAAIVMWAVGAMFVKRSTGAWVSPTRRHAD